MAGSDLINKTFLTGSFHKGKETHWYGKIAKVSICAYNIAC